MPKAERVKREASKKLSNAAKKCKSLKVLFSSTAAKKRKLTDELELEACSNDNGSDHSDYSLLAEEPLKPKLIGNLKTSSVSDTFQSSSVIKDGFDFHASFDETSQDIDKVLPKVLLEIPEHLMQLESAPFERNNSNEENQPLTNIDAYDKLKVCFECFENDPRSSDLTVDFLTRRSSERRVGLLTVELDYLPSSWITYRRVGLLTVELDYLPSSWITYRRVGLLTVELDYLPSSWITYRRVGLLTVELDYLPSSWITYRRVGLLTVELDYLPSSWITYRRVGLLTVELDYLPSSWITYRRVGLLTVELDYLPSSWITYRRVGLLTVELDYLPSSWITYRRVGLLTYRRVGLLICYRRVASKCHLLT
ncbi:hypothetical protein FQR65_LT00310 [Abscondita terminalis]|nr:hypothetical protein FQR65_LT00310 [Abscondita terminalis]